MPPVLDRRVAFDERSRSYAMRPLLAKRIERVAKVWDVPKPPLPLDQKEEGACVAFGVCAELACDPVQYQVSNEYAFAYYEDVRRLDRAEGRYFESGATVLAGIKLAKQRGLITTYRWAFGLDDCIDILVSHGPVILGIGWFSSMYSTLPGGLVEVSGDLVGGHCILAIGYLPEYRPAPNGPDVGPVVVLQNSWGSFWGINGVGYIRTSDLDKLLKDDGEACVVTDAPLAPPIPVPRPKPRQPWWRRLVRW